MTRLNHKCIRNILSVECSGTTTSCYQYWILHCHPPGDAGAGRGREDRGEASASDQGLFTARCCNTSHENHFLYNLSLTKAPCTNLGILQCLYLFFETETIHICRNFRKPSGQSFIVKLRQGSARDGSQGERPQSLKPCQELTLKLVATFPPPPPGSLITPD